MCHFLHNEPILLLFIIHKFLLPQRLHLGLLVVPIIFVEKRDIEIYFSLPVASPWLDDTNCLDCFNTCLHLSITAALLFLLLPRCTQSLFLRALSCLQFPLCGQSVDFLSLDPLAHRYQHLVNGYLELCGHINSSIVGAARHSFRTLCPQIVLESVGKNQTEVINNVAYCVIRASLESLLDPLPIHRLSNVGSIISWIVWLYKEMHVLQIRLVTK
mmetsp:Transcript_37352/g.111905  ORF Transcript_37352/g.111905 Transcript_37352/m.111905 type:complete len:215 (+) Transcript_37352:5575-6219(+)